MARNALITTGSTGLLFTLVGCVTVGDVHGDAAGRAEWAGEGPLMKALLGRDQYLDFPEVDISVPGQHEFVLEDAPALWMRPYVVVSSTVNADSLRDAQVDVTVRDEDGDEVLRCGGTLEPIEPRWRNGWVRSGGGEQWRYWHWQAEAIRFRAGRRYLVTIESTGGVPGGPVLAHVQFHKKNNY